MSIHGNGQTIRNFIYVEDVARAFETILFNGEITQIYNIGTDNEHSVIDISKLLHSKLCPDKQFDECVNYVEDRPFNDFRYCVDSGRLLDLGWNTITSFQDGIEKTIQWYRENDIATYFVNK